MLFNCFCFKNTLICVDKLQFDLFALKYLTESTHFFSFINVNFHYSFINSLKQFIINEKITHRIICLFYFQHECERVILQPFLYYGTICEKKEIMFCLIKNKNDSLLGFKSTTLQ